MRSDGVVAITSASHAEGREFEPRSDLYRFKAFTKDSFIPCLQQVWDMLFQIKCSRRHLFVGKSNLVARGSLTVRLFPAISRLRLIYFVACRLPKDTRSERGSNSRPSACKADVITTTPSDQELLIEYCLLNRVTVCRGVMFS